MAKTSTVQIVVTVTGDGVDNVSRSAPVTNTNAPSSGTFPYPLVSGFNTINVPSGSKGVWIRPPAGNAVSLTLKGISGDTGTPVDPSQDFYLPLLSTSTSIAITAGGAVTVGLQWT